MPTEAKRTAPSILKMKGREKIACITAYDAPFAAIADSVGFDIILVGDSLGNVVLGYENTIPVTVDDMVHHTKAVRTGVHKALLVVDMPFGSYGGSVAQAVETATRLVKAGAEAVKLEGHHPEAVDAITRLGVPVMGHLGMTPQWVNRFGGFRLQGKEKDAEDKMVEQADRLVESGAFALVLELIPQDLAKAVTQRVAIPSIGIGAGPYCDGQIQVMHDVLGVTSAEFRHVKRYANLGEATSSALASYIQDVRAEKFPMKEHSF